MVELCTHPAIERAELETLHLQQARLPSTLPGTAVGGVIRLPTATECGKSGRSKIRDKTVNAERTRMWHDLVANAVARTMHRPL